MGVRNNYLTVPQEQLFLELEVEQACSEPLILQQQTEMHLNSTCNLDCEAHQLNCECFLPQSIYATPSVFFFIYTRHMKNPLKETERCGTSRNTAFFSLVLVGQRFRVC